MKGDREDRLKGFVMSRRRGDAQIKGAIHNRKKKACMASKELDVEMRAKRRRDMGIKNLV